MTRAKKLVPVLLAVLAALAAALCLHLCFNRLQLRQINRLPSWAEPPVPPGQTLSYATTGAYPGFSDQPVSWEEGQTGRDFYKLLEQHTYAPIALLGPRPGGIAVSTATGCSPEYVAYWDRLFLWFPALREETPVWRGYLPSSPWSFGEKLRALCNH